MRHRVGIAIIVLLGFAVSADAQIRLRRIITPQTPPEATPNFVPTGNGATNTWTPNGAATNWESVDDPVGSPDDDTTYSSRADSDGDQMFTFNTPAISGTINSVSVTTRYRAGASTFVLLTRVLRVGGTDYYGSGAVVSSTSYVTTTTTWVTNPRTGVAWTANDVNGVGGNAIQQFGLRGQVLASGESTRLTQIYLTIDYIEGGGGNQPPAAPSGYSPADNAINVPVVRTLSCSQQADATSYRIFFSTTSPVALNAANELTLADPSICSHTVSGLTNSDEYFWIVCPVNGAGETCGAEQSFTTVAAGGEMDLIAAAANCADSNDNSPTGRNPRLGWTCAKQETWDQMVADFFAVCPSATAGVSCAATPATLGGKNFKTIKGYCDSPVYNGIVGTYADFGQWNAMCYQWTGDAAYITNATFGMWAKVQEWYFDLAPHADPNASRIKNGMMTIMLEWAWPALSAGERQQMVDEIDGDNTRAYGPAYFNGTPPWDDSDQLLGQAYLPIALMHVILPNNASNEAIWNDPEWGGLTATSAVPRTTARNTIRFYFENLCVGGEWCEAAEYNLETLPWTIVMMQAISDAMGSDQFPEMTAYLTSFANAIIARITPDRLKYLQWGDEEVVDVWRTFTISNVLTTLSGMLQGSAKGQELQQLILDLNAQYGETGNNSMAPAIRWWGMLVYNPYLSGVEWRNTKSFYASGEGMMLLRSGWTASDCLFMNHAAPRYPDATLGYFTVHHQAWYQSDIQLYCNGEWVLYHPFTYAGASTFGEGTNVVLANGLPQAPEYKKVRATSVADTHAYLSATTGGSHVQKTFWDPPAVTLNEQTRDAIFVPAQKVVITYDRVHALEVTGGNNAKYKYFGCNFLGEFVNQAQARQAYTWHIPVAPTFASGSYTWATPQTNQTVRWTPLVPLAANLTKTVYDLSTTFANRAPTGGRCGWRDTEIGVGTNQYEDDLSPYNWKLVKLWPTSMGDFHTYLNVFQVGTGTATPTVIQNNNAECAHVVTTGMNDILACFNATQGADLNDTPYHSSHAAVLDSVRLRGAGSFTVAYTASATTTEFYLAHLDPARTWTYTIDGGGSNAISEDSGGFARIPLSLAAGPHTIVVTGS